MRSLPPALPWIAAPAAATSLLFLLSLPAASFANPPSSPQSVILISIDGLRPDAITTHGPKRLPALYRLRREDAFTDNARTAVTQTHTLPNHTGMITGRLVDGPDGHGWTWKTSPYPFTSGVPASPPEPTSTR